MRSIGPHPVLECSSQKSRVEKSKRTVFSSAPNVSEITMVAIWRLRLGALQSRDQHFTRVVSSGGQEKGTGNKA